MTFNMIDWAYGFGGGLLIGLSAALLLLLNGRIAGISGIVGGLLTGGLRGEGGERAAFLIGLIGAPMVYAFVAGGPAVNASTSVLTLAAAGCLVGVGVRMGSGCTSGHGVCGMSRFSLRSFAAAATFMAVGAVVVTIGRHLLGGL